MEGKSRNQRPACTVLLAQRQPLFRSPQPAGLPCPVYLRQNGRKDNPDQSVTGAAAVGNILKRPQ
ncbi:hypothetical protein [Pantoea agglomerans]|uniref:hypothetical protein n=1 Tax=Enterobacter agglomerans TaxID=549 RepID=UPI00289836DE|nr:hypothetical protein [Pantoea agglomerans]WNK37992.1 hypothetical protein RM158_24005 [Pantoea agglomerans]WNK74130.1 hypothetical protein RM155_23460 [Pantoea agglomerans]